MQVNSKNELPLPNEMGMWFSDDGQECFIRFTDGQFQIMSSCGPMTARHSNLDHAIKIFGLKPARWVRMSKPEFADLPKKPLLCLTNLRSPIGVAVPEFRAILPGSTPRIMQLKYTNLDWTKYVPVWHPHNDQEAVEILESGVRHAKESEFWM